MTKKTTTLDELAEMIAEGFRHTATAEDMQLVKDTLGSIINCTLPEHNHSYE